MSDPSTWTGARVMRLRYPISMAEIALMARLGGIPDELSPFKSAGEVRESEAFKATRDEEAEALSHMSPIWGGA